MNEEVFLWLPQLYYVAANGKQWLTWASSQKPRDFTVTRSHTIVIYTANVLAIFICIQGRILKSLFLETA